MVAVLGILSISIFGLAVFVLLAGPKTNQRTFFALATIFMATIIDLLALTPFIIQSVTIPISVTYNETGHMMASAVMLIYLSWAVIGLIQGFRTLKGIQKNKATILLCRHHFFRNCNCVYKYHFTANGHQHI